MKGEGRQTSTLQNTPRCDGDRVSPRSLPDADNKRYNRTQTKADGQKDVDALVGVVTESGVFDAADGRHFGAGVVPRMELGCGGR